MSAAPWRRLSPSPSLTRGFVALEHRAFRLLFYSTITSGVGGQLQQTANLWQLYAITGSPLHVGLNGLARAIPIICFSLIGGVIADRFDRKKIIITTQTANACVALVLGGLTLTGRIQIWHIYAATFLNATMMSASAPARRAVVASIVPRHHLVNAMALQSSVNQIQRIVAPSLAGVLIAAFGLPITYSVNGIVHFITAFNLSFVPLGPLPTRPTGSPLRNVLEGLAFVRMRSIILVLLATDAAAMLFGNYVAVLPVIADNFDVGPAGFGVLSSAPAIGGMAGTILLLNSLLGPKLRTRPKLEVYESGVPLVDTTHKRMSIKFFVIAMIFILFDVEIAFVYPWALVFRSVGWPLFLEMLVFLVILAVGYAYIWKKGAFDW